VEEVLEAAGLRLGHVHAIAVAIGPGSFTGLRVGLSYAKGIASARNIAIAGVSSLDALALCADRLSAGSFIYPLIDARRGEVYTGLYRFAAGALEKRSSDLVVPLASFAAGLTDDAILVGYSVAEQVRTMASAAGRNVMLIDNGRLRMRGSFVAALGGARVAHDGGDAVATLEPLYVRSPDAITISSGLKPGEDIDGTPRGRTHPATARP
jgi:tRNA threonylcarbamoyladenosine biosynthesis protein TsaB